MSLLYTVCGVNDTMLDMVGRSKFIYSLKQFTECLLCVLYFFLPTFNLTKCVSSLGFLDTHTSAFSRTSGLLHHGNNSFSFCFVSVKNSAIDQCFFKCRLVKKDFSIIGNETVLIFLCYLKYQMKYSNFKNQSYKTKY